MTRLQGSEGLLAGRRAFGAPARTRPGWQAAVAASALLYGRVRLPGRVSAATRAGASATRRLAAFIWRDHRLVTIATGLALVPRALAALAFRPAVFTPDSFGYLSQALRFSPGMTRPFGYPIMLRTLAPLHSLLVVTSLQHLMGIATALLGYAVLRRWGLPGWGATLAACPTLFDTREIVLESAILPDVLYALLLTLAAVILLLPPVPGWRRCGAAGLLLAWAAVVRGNGAPEMAAVLAVLLIWRVGWRATAAAAAAFALPLLGYMGVFDLNHGSFALTESDGMFLWSRTMTFANCAVIKPLPDLRPLCPDRQPIHPAGPAPAWSVPAMLTSPNPAAYLWERGAWWRHDAHPGINAANNALATRFALDAIRAQPTDYLRTVASGVLQTFLATDRSQTVRSLHFTPAPDVRALDGRRIRQLRAYARLTSNSHPVEPYAYFLYLYQEPVYFPGYVFGLLMVIGLAGVGLRWRRRRSGGAADRRAGGAAPRRGGPGALPWALAAVGIIAPVAVHEAHYRYAITVVPLACVAAGLAFARRRAEAPPASPEAGPSAALSERGGTTGAAESPAVLAGLPALRLPAARHGGERLQPSPAVGSARLVPGPGHPD